MTDHKMKTQTLTDLILFIKGDINNEKKIVALFNTIVICLDPERHAQYNFY